MSPRPKNIRKVNNMPSVAGFRPVISNNSCGRNNILHFEEYETIRLCDYEMKTQQEASHLNGCVTPYPQPNIYQCKAKDSQGIRLWCRNNDRSEACHIPTVNGSVADHVVSCSTISIRHSKSVRQYVRYVFPKTSTPVILTLIRIRL